MARILNAKYICRHYVPAVLTTVGIGILLVTFRLGDPLARLSYDVPFIFRTNLEVTNDVVLLYVNEATLTKLGTSAPGILDRRNFAHLLKRLTGARLVFFDFEFSNPSVDPKSDEEFAEAIRANGRVVLGASFQTSELPSGALTLEKNPPILSLRTNALAWGMLIFQPLDPDNGVRQIYRGDPHSTNVVWILAKLVDAPVTRNPDQRLSERWMNYYGPPGRPRTPVPGYSVDQALEELGVPASAFKDKIVIVGARFTSASGGAKPERFASPYSRFGGPDSPGAEVHATALLNLLREDWLNRMTLGMQIALVAVWGSLLTVILISVPLRTAVWVALAAAPVVAAISFYLQWHNHVWWPWLVSAAIQPAVALLGAMLVNYVAPRPKPQYDAFISYRRETGAETARLIRTELRTRGYRAFLDVEDLGSNLFDERLLREIQNAPSFILILGPGALDRCVNPDDWVRRELAHAIYRQRNIIPVLKDGFQFPPAANLPPDIAALPRYNSVLYSHDQFEATINKLVSFMEA